MKPTIDKAKLRQLVQMFSGMGLLQLPTQLPSGKLTLYQHQPNPRLNRSRHWPFAASYQAARDASPSDRPVR